MYQLLVDAMNQPMAFVVSFGLPLAALWLIVACIWHREAIKATFSAALLVALMIALLDGNGMLRYFLDMGPLNTQQATILNVSLMTLLATAVVFSITKWVESPPTKSRT